jgi:glyoxylase-like metal-dependent hydrolase (beta-lactamase superfamily II)
VYQLNGIDVIDTQLSSVRTNPTMGAGQFAIPAELKRFAQGPAPVTVPYQWVIRRQFIGTYLDSDAVTHDPGTSQGLRLQDVGPGVALVQGGTHNALVVEMQDYLIVFDAPVGDTYSKWLLEAAAAKFSGKPVKYLVLTHHHMDHSSGTRLYTAQGATLVVGAGNAPFFRSSFSAPHRTNPVVVQGSIADARITEVADRLVLTDGKREVGIYAMENPHAAGMVMGYVTDAKLGFVTDVWSPGTPLGPKPNPGQISVVNAVKKHGLTPERFAGGHGSTQPYAELLKHVGG